MQFLQLMRHWIFVSFSVFLTGTITSAFGQASPAPQLNVMQTAETLGKGGYTTNLGMFQFDKETRVPKNGQRVVIGNFEELHLAELEIETFLVPIRFTYGIGERLDLTVGGTFSTGGVRKIIPDFYKLGDPMKENLSLDPTRDRRAYEQALFDGVVGLKYNIKPDVGDGLPSVSVGGEMQIGFTADNKLNSDNEFIDHTPDNSFPFVGISTYMVGTQRFDLFKVHAGVGSQSFLQVPQDNGFVPVGVDAWW